MTFSIRTTITDIRGGLRAGLVLAGCAVAILAGCSGARDTAQNDPELARIERDMFDAVNRFRVSQGLRSLAWSETIAGQARLHSRDMASDRIPLDHTGAEGRSETIAETIPWTSISENVAFSDRLEGLVPFVRDRWLESPGHRTNIVGNFNLTGIGVAKSEDGRYFFTQIFVLTD